MFGDKRPTCSESWTENGHDVSCMRFAVITVDGVAYCDKHVDETEVSDR